MYTAIHYIPLGKKMYSPGEVINEPLDKKTEKRLMNAGAIRKESGWQPPQKPQEPEEPMEPQEPEEAPEEDEEELARELMGDLVKGGKKK